MDNRIARLRHALARHELDGALISNAPNRRYLSGFTGSAGYLLITPDDAVIATDFRYYEQSASQAPAFRLHRVAGAFDAWAGALFAGLAGKKIAFEAGDMTVATHRQFKKLLAALPEPGRPALVPTPNLVESLRLFKEPEEIVALQKAVDLGDAAFTHVAERVEPGWTEKRVAWEIEKYIREHGGDGLSFDTIVAGGPWGAMPHAYPRERKLEPGEGVVIDMGCDVAGYMSDLTRTIVLGKPDDQFRKIYDIVLTAQLTAEEMVKPGMTGEECHMIAHNVIDAAGYGETFGHGLGHGIGLQVHEAPRVARTSTDELKDTMVFTIEPGIYITGWGGVRIEDMVVLEAGKPRVMSRAPKLRFAG
ncbi:MAG TPA: Xaa-Pro peptidase family protein [Dehalococcoidia bacterium]|nr:Xaa-Pro peptidase family protein [Dehalococcoidia bacterium]